MSHSLLNYHIIDGEPCGGDASLVEIAEYYGERLFEMRHALEDWVKCSDTPEEWMRCRDQAKKVLKYHVNWGLSYDL